MPLGLGKLMYIEAIYFTVFWQLQVVRTFVPWLAVDEYQVRIH